MAEKQIKTIGVLTSGGDAPGMNAAIRAVVRCALHYGYEVMGINRGYHGLWRGDIHPLNTRSVSEKLQRGGTFLMTARSATFQTEDGLNKALSMAEVFNIDCLVVIGGDGSFHGAQSLSNRGLPVIGIPGTIDNDIGCTEYTIGYDTAMNTAMECIDRLKDTASSHERCSVIEVMGRSAGYIALNVAICCGAEVVMIPEYPVNFERDVIKRLLDCRNSGKNHYVVVVAEGAGSAIEIAKRIEEVTGINSRATVLGHLQRGGSPTVRDRLLASLMGAHAVDCIHAGVLNRLICQQGGKVVDIDINEGMKMNKTLSEETVKASNIIAL